MGGRCTLFIELGDHVGGGGEVHTVYRARRPCGCVRELVWPSGKALGWLAEGPRFESASAVFSLQKLWRMDTVL